MPSSDIAVSVRGLSKSYTIAHNAQQHTTAAEALVSKLRRPFQKPERETFWALKDVEFDIKKGDVVGIIGRNGAGKSTLLKILSRITEPTTGQIDLYGRVGSLLEVGTGFHPELTGRENVFLNGAILGMSKREIARQFDAIVDFSGTEQFLDTPVKRYSSGMYVRLAFAVAAHLSPEILIVDEVLAVGDSEFQKKCLGKMKDVATSGRTVLFVSHNLNSVVNLCTSALLLQRGRLQIMGNSEEVIAHYMAYGTPQAANDLSEHQNRKAGCYPYLFRLDILDAADAPKANYSPGESVKLRFRINAPNPILSPHISIGFTSLKGERIFAIANYLSASEVGVLLGQETVEVTFVMPHLVPGSYVLDVGLVDGGARFLDEIYAAAAIEVKDTNFLQTTYPYFPEMGSVLVASSWQVLSHCENERPTIHS